MSRLLYNFGFIVRETGRALDNLGCIVEGSNAHWEKLWRHKSIQNIGFVKPNVTSNSFVAPSATLVADVGVGDKSSVWFGSVVRGDAAKVTIGKNTNIQDGVVIATARSNFKGRCPETKIGDNVTIGHGATIHGAEIEDNAFIGMGSVIPKIESGAIVAAGAVLKTGQRVAAGEIWAGNPAKFLRNVKDNEKEFMKPSADKYHELANDYMKA